MRRSKIISKILRAGISLLLLAGWPLLGLAQEAIQVDPGIADYQKASGVSGNLSSVGSDTILNLMTLWAEGFKKAYPNVNIQIELATPQFLGENIYWDILSPGFKA